MVRQVLKVRRLSEKVRTETLNLFTRLPNRIADERLRSSFESSIVKKLRPQKRSQDLADRAKATFLLTEDACRATNSRIRSTWSGSPSYSEGDVLHVASRKIAQILGPFRIDRMLSLGRFGPGSTYSCRGVDVSRARKFSLTDVTPEFNKLARGLLAEYPLWAQYLTDSDAFASVCPLLTIVPGGRYSTVPKDASTDRSIIVEPTINSWFQQGIGRAIRERLLSHAGVDLNSQELNQRLAQLASITDDLATVDLSNASDLISKNLVKELLPEDWFFWLNITRSRRVLIDGNWVELEKFSSMGNGFTFDLESLIFYALSYAIVVLEGFNPFWVTTFGDDIIVPSGVRERLVKVFSEVGFQINLKKSFFTGPFRESCGKDYHLGNDIRGIYIKDLNTDVDLMKVHNRMYEWALRHNFDWSAERGFILQQLRHIKARVPRCVGDLGIFSSFDEAVPTVSRHGAETYKFKALFPICLQKERADRFVVLDRMQGSEFAKNSVQLRSDVIAYRIGEVEVFRPDF